jgi:hypothetical protein
LKNNIKHYVCQGHIDEKAAADNADAGKAAADKLVEEAKAAEE